MVTWLSIHFNPTAAVHSFLAALLYQSKLYNLSSVFVIEVILLRLSLTENISPLELIFSWLFNNVSNHPLPDLCIDNIAKSLTAVHAHSFLTNKGNIRPLLTWKKKIDRQSTPPLPIVSIWRRIVHIGNFSIRNSGIVAGFLSLFIYHVCLHETKKHPILLERQGENVHADERDQAQYGYPQREGISPGGLCAYSSCILRSKWQRSLTGSQG
jgi:hypothetical protein